MFAAINKWRNNSGSNRRWGGGVRCWCVAAADSKGGGRGRDGDGSQYPFHLFFCYHFGWSFHLASVELCSRNSNMENITISPLRQATGLKNGNFPIILVDRPSQCRKQYVCNTKDNNHACRLQKHNEPWRPLLYHGCHSAPPPAPRHRNIRQRAMQQGYIVKTRENYH